MPQLGETVAEGKITKWFKSAGDAVKPGDNLFEIETDKVSMEVPAIAAGVLAEIRVQAGEVAPVGAVVAVIAGEGEAAATAPAPSSARPAKAGPQSQRSWIPACAGMSGLQRQHAAAAAPSQLDPFREVRTPERNFGPARLPGGTVGDAAGAPARGRGRHRSRRTSKAPARTAASSRATSKPRAAAQARGARLPARPPSGRSGQGALSRSCRYEEVPLDAMRAHHRRAADCRRSRPSRISI